MGFVCKNGGSGHLVKLAQRDGLIGGERLEESESGRDHDGRFAALGELPEITPALGASPPARHPM